MHPAAAALLATVALSRAATSQLWEPDGGNWSPESRLPDFSHAGYASGNHPIPSFPEVTDVRQHGAAGDGRSDDSAAFQAPIRAVAASGKPGAVRVPPGRHCGAHGTFWNIRAQRPQSHPGGFGPASINLVGITTREASVTDTDGRWFEAIPPDELRPADLHAAQLDRRLRRSR